MKTIKIYGCSDDLVEIEGDVKGADEYGVYDETGKTYFIIRSKVTGESINIHPVYHGYWCFAIGTDDNFCENFPDWNIKRVWGDEVDYSETVYIDVPNDSKIKKMKVGK